MTSFGRTLAGFGLALLTSTSVMAADLNGMRGMKDAGYMPPIHQSTQTGLYLRGDIGWAQNEVGSMYEPPIYDLYGVGAGRSTTYGGGIGWYFSKNVRADITLDYRGDASLRGTVSDPFATVQGERQFGMNNLVGLVNVYYDFDLRSHFTPYIGVGLGFSRNRTTFGTVAIAPSVGPCSGPAPTTTCEADFDGATTYSAAGALMAGFSAKLHDRVYLDAGYRFLYMGDAKTGDIRTRSTDLVTGVVTNGSAADPYVNDIHAHEFRVGLRFNTR
jgi:opacity protein-like surface antigen